jgi:hypothetical protein
MLFEVLALAADLALVVATQRSGGRPGDDTDAQQLHLAMKAIRLRNDQRAVGDPELLGFGG